MDTKYYLRERLSTSPASSNNIITWPSKRKSEIALHGLPKTKVATTKQLTPKDGTKFGAPKIFKYTENEIKFIIKMCLMLQSEMMKST